jgi:hypothetical protein
MIDKRRQRKDDDLSSIIMKKRISLLKDTYIKKINLRRRTGVLLTYSIFIISNRNFYKGYQKA